MKKLIGTLVAAMLAAAVFADIGFGTWGRAIWTPLAWDGKNVTMGQGISWGTQPRVGISIGGSSDNIGFALDIKADGDDAVTDVDFKTETTAQTRVIHLNDNAFAWAKPCDWFKITFGQWFDDTLRGSIGFGSRNWIRCWNTCVGDDATFARIHSTQENYDTPMKGVLLSLMPVDGLYVAAGLNIGYAYNKHVDILKISQYQVGYTIDGVVAIKAQYIGNETALSMGSGGAADKGTVNAAVDLLMIEGSKISVGAFIPFAKNATIDIAATYSGSFDAISLNAYLVADIIRDKSADFGLQFGVGVGYDLGDGMSIEGDVRGNIAIASKTNGAMSVGAYFNKGFSNGCLGVGVMGAFGFGGATANGPWSSYAADTGKANIVIPVKMDYWF